MDRSLYLLVFSNRFDFPPTGQQFDLFERPWCVVHPWHHGTNIKHIAGVSVQFLQKHLVMLHHVPLKRVVDMAIKMIPTMKMILQRLYEDNVTGKLTDERFAKLSAAYEAEQAELKQSVESLSVIVEASEAQAVNVRSFLKIVKKYTEPTSLTPQLLHEFVDKIVVHEADKSSGHRIQRIDVHYNFIGEVDFSPEFRR